MSKIIAVIISGVPSDISREKSDELCKAVEKSLSNMETGAVCFLEKRKSEEEPRIMVCEYLATSEAIASMEKNWKNLAHMRVRDTAWEFFSSAKIKCVE